MTQSWIQGAWTYRSFHNTVDPVNELDDILLAEFEMTFEAAPAGEVRGQLALRPTPPDPPQETDPRLILTGSLQDGSPAAARFRGVGLDDTGAKGWIYDYVAYLVPNWIGSKARIGGKDQHAAMVGSVMRVVDHPGAGGTVRPGGQVFSFIAVRREFPEPRTIIPIPSPVLEMLASRHHRLHHYIWHALRNGWENSIGPDVRKEVTNLGWAPPRPALTSGGDPFLSNGSGEDFLFMHRQMIGEVNKTLQDNKQDPIKGWGTIPPPGAVMNEPDFTENPPKLPVAGNPDGFAVPTNWNPADDPMLRQRLEALKSGEFYWSRMRWWDRQYKDPAYLATLTLGELGALLEWTVHNDMHMRWASAPRNPDSGEIDTRADADIRPLWDNPVYDHLGEQYSSHVNPVFWRLHGWVDQRIEDWFRAHEEAHKGEVKRATVMDTSWFEPGAWVQVSMPWTGKMDMRMSLAAGGHGTGKGHDMSGDPVKEMEQIVALLFGPPPAAETLSAPVRPPRGRLHHRMRGF